MNKKVNLSFTNYFPIGTKTLQNFYFTVHSQNSETYHKSPIIYGAKPLFTVQTHSFWDLELSDHQQQIICKLFIVNPNSSQKTDIFISETTLPINITSDYQQQAILYDGSQKVGILTYTVQSSTQKAKTYKNIFSHQTQRQQIQQASFKISKAQSYFQRDILNYSLNSQDQRYRVDITPCHSNQSSFIKLDVNPDKTENYFFSNLNQSCIPERYQFQKDNSFIMDSSLQMKKQGEISSLEKWLKKLKNHQTEKYHFQNKIIEFQPKIPQKYLKSQQNYDTKINFKSLKFNQEQKNDFLIESMCIHSIDDQITNPKELLFECSFIAKSKGQNNKNAADRIVLNNLNANIPSNKNLQIKINLQNTSNSKQIEKVSGIFIKQNFVNQKQIPLFNKNDKVLATLKYKAKKIQNASIQCLPPIDEDPLQVANQNGNISFTGSSPEKILGLKNKIRQRKMNNTIIRRHVEKDLKIKKYSYDEAQQKQKDQSYLNSPTRSKAETKNMDTSQISIKENSEFSSQNQFKRSNTENLPFFRLQNQAQQNTQTNRSQNSPNRYGAQNLKKSFLNSQNKYQNSFSPTKSLSKTKNSNYLFLKSTNLSDLQEQQSEQQETYLNDQSFIKSQNGSYSPSKRISLVEYNRQKNLQLKKTNPKNDSNLILGQSTFIVDISSVSVILYKALSQEMKQSGKFLILKSDKGETFITETVFSDHINLGWKKKSYQFTSSIIQISLYQRTGYSSQSQNRHNFTVIIKFIDLMKAIKQNFYRQQIFVDGHAIGTIVLLYDILMQRHNFSKKNCQQQKFSDLFTKNTIEKRTRSKNYSEMTKKNLSKIQQKSTIKNQSGQSNRKRSKTLQSSKNPLFLPLIEKKVLRKQRTYEGGKNVKMGKAQRFINYNGAEI